MDHSSSGSHGSMGLKKAILGFVQAKEAEALSPRTIQSYQLHLETWAQYMGERSVNGITAQDVRAYLAYLRTEYVPKRFNGKTTPLSQKSLRNVYITLSSFFAWASEELQAPDPMDAVTAPKFQHPEVEPFTLEHVEALLKAAEYSREADTRDRRRFVRRLRLRVTSPRGAELLNIFADPDLTVLSARVNGRPYGVAGERFMLNFYGLPPEGLEIDLQVPAGQTVRLHMADQTKDLPGAANPPARPTDLIPAPQPAFLFGASTWVRRTYVLSRLSTR